MLRAGVDVAALLVELSADNMPAKTLSKDVLSVAIKADGVAAHEHSPTRILATEAGAVCAGALVLVPVSEGRPPLGKRRRGQLVWQLRKRLAVTLRIWLILHELLRGHRVALVLVLGWRWADVLVPVAHVILVHDSRGRLIDMLPVIYWTRTLVLVIHN